MIATAAPELVLRSRALREMLRTDSGPLAAVSIGTVPILWNNVDVTELRLGTGAATILDEIARLGYDGCQLGLGFPEGRELRDALAVRELRLAEVYASLPTSADGPADGALDEAVERLRLLVAGDGDVLCVALDGSPERSAWAGRADADGAPRLTADGWRRLVDVVNDLARATAEAGRRLAFHPHAGTFVETPAETDHLLAATEPDLVPLCLDVGHWLVGGGDPVAALRRYGDRVTHVHLKDVDPTVLARLRSGELADFGAAVRARAVHRARRRPARPRRLSRGPRGTRLSRLADGRAGQQLGTPVGGGRDRSSRPCPCAADRPSRAGHRSRARGMKIALIGAGRIGRLHARLLSSTPGVDRLIVADADAARAAEVAGEVGAEAATSIDDALAAADASVIAAATSAHAELIRASIAGALPTFCEKPLSNDLEDSIALTGEIEGSGVPFQLGFQRRFDRGYAEARRKVATGELGNLYIVRLAGHDPAPPHESYIPQSGGLFRDFSIHDFDILRWLTGAEVEEVYADGGVLGFPVFAKYGDVDTAVATLRLTTGVLGVLTCARHDPLGYDIRAELFGSGEFDQRRPRPADADALGRAGSPAAGRPGLGGLHRPIRAGLRGRVR